MATLDELNNVDADPDPEANEAAHAGPGGKPRRRHIFRRRRQAGADEEPPDHRVVLQVNEFGRVTEEIQVKDPVAATHWDVRLWRRLR